LWLRSSRREKLQTLSPLLKVLPETSSQRLAESCLAVNIMVKIMKLWNCRFSVIKRGAASIGARLFMKPA
jgi:hypothetical protein